MTILTITFIFDVLTAYTLYRYFIFQNEYLAQLAFVHVNWHIFYSIFTTMIIYAGSTVKRKVGKKNTPILISFFLAGSRVTFDRFWLFL